MTHALEFMRQVLQVFDLKFSPVKLKALNPPSGILRPAVSLGSLPTEPGSLHPQRHVFILTRDIGSHLLRLLCYRLQLA